MGFIAKYCKIVKIFKLSDIPNKKLMEELTIHLIGLILHNFEIVIIAYVVLFDQDWTFKPKP